MHPHTDTDRPPTLPPGRHTPGMIWLVLAPWLKCTALTCPSPIRGPYWLRQLAADKRGLGGVGSSITGEVTLWWSHGRVAGSCSPGEDPALLSSSLLSGQTGWINHLQRFQHLPKQFQIGINGRWGCCSLCLISSTKCGFISYKMKPSVARRCKDQVREDGGRGWQRERGEMCVCTHMCMCMLFNAYVCACVFFARLWRWRAGREMEHCETDAE